MKFDVGLCEQRPPISTRYMELTEHNALEVAGFTGGICMNFDDGKAVKMPGGLGEIITPDCIVVEDSPGMFTAMSAEDFHIKYRVIARPDELS